jgi:hypothetical protein
MQARTAKVVVFIAMALALNHARCVAACIADPCAQAQTQQPNCHHHKSPDTNTNRGCAFPAANDAQVAASAVAQNVSVTPEPIANTLVAPYLYALPVEDAPQGSPPILTSISVLRV